LILGSDATTVAVLIELGFPVPVRVWAANSLETLDILRMLSILVGTGLVMVFATVGILMLEVS